MKQVPIIEFCLSLVKSMKIKIEIFPKFNNYVVSKKISALNTLL